MVLRYKPACARALDDDRFGDEFRCRSIADSWDDNNDDNNDNNNDDNDVGLFLKARHVVIEARGGPTGLDAADCCLESLKDEKELAYREKRPPKRDPNGKVMFAFKPADYAPADAALTRMRRKAYLAALRRYDFVEINNISQSAMSSAQPFLMAALLGDASAVDRMLREEPSNARLVDESTGQSALTWTAHANVFRLLLDAPEIEVNHADLSGETALHRSCNLGNTARLKLLLAMPNIDVNRVDMWGNTALRAAAVRGHLSIVRHLLTVPDIDLSIRNDRGYSACDDAVRQGFPKIAREIDPLPPSSIDEISRLPGKAEAGQTCPICIDFQCRRWNSGHLLCCGAMICFACRDKLYEASGSFRLPCPMCRAPTAVTFEEKASQLRARAARGDLSAVFIQANWHTIGLNGFRRDPKEANRLYRLVADDEGDPFVLVALGESYEQLQDKQSALDCFERAGDMGSANLADMLQKGRGVAKDAARAVRCYERAVMQNDHQGIKKTAIVKLANLLEKGDEGVPRDVRRAMRLSLWGAEKFNDMISMMKIGGMCQQAHVGFDGSCSGTSVEAVWWFCRAKDSCSDHAQYGTGGLACTTPDITEFTEFVNEGMKLQAALRCAECAVGPTDDKKLSTCKGCLSVVYCGAGCQRKHWSRHKKQCELRKRERAAELTEAMSEEFTALAGHSDYNIPD